MMCKSPYIKQDMTSSKPRHKEARAAHTPFPCGRCLPCRINKSREWTLRLLLEQTQHQDSSFVTYTYNDEHLPKDGSLHPSHLRNYFKRLRKYISPIKLRYFAVGEYGTENFRPHYHAVLYGLGIPDSRIIDLKWAHKGEKIGYTYVGDLNKNSARYMTQYITKNLKNMNEEFNKLKYPQLVGKHPEFMVSSRLNGGIGIGAIEKIAEKMKKTSYIEPEIFREIRIDGGIRPLGRYLTKKLAEKLGLSHEICEKAVYDYQEEIFDKHLKNGEDYKKNIVDEKKNERNSQSKRQKLFKQKRKL